MPRVVVEVSEEEMEVLKAQKRRLSVTWEQAVIRGLAMGPTPLERTGLPDPIKEAAVGAMADREFVEELREVKGR
jgi:hypothetical protein